MSLDLTEADYEKAYRVLESCRDGAPIATPDEREVLNNAHAIIQEIEARNSN